MNVVYLVDFFTFLFSAQDEEHSSGLVTRRKVR